MDIIIWRNGEDYNQDVCPLIKSFYPDAVFAEGGAAAEASGNAADKTGSAGEKSEAAETSEADGTSGEGSSLDLYFDLTSDCMTVRIRQQGREVFAETEAFAGGERRDYRNALLRMLYRGLSGLTGKKLPWGILTGVRPTKLVYERLADMTKDEIRDYMAETYYCSADKIEVSLITAAREKELLTQCRPEEGYSLYIGIPFCPTTCLYCSFTSYPLERFGGYVEPYLEALKKEIRFASESMGGKAPMSVYFGGGTPTTLSAEQLRDLIGYVKNSFDFSGVKEFTVEAGRPDSLTYEKLAVLKELGVDRISINPQSMCQETLDLIGRRHTVEQIEEAFAMARKAGHDNINMDLIIGLTGETPEHVRRTLERIRPLNPESLTVHTLALKRAARLNLEKERYVDMQAVDVPVMQQLTAAYAKENGYLPYYLYRQKNMAENLENVGYARYGKECLYNIVIMEERQTILALGAGASSKFYFPAENRLERVENVKSLKDYVERIDEMIERKLVFIEKNRAALKEGSVVW
ncbi:MAG: coproporphyrinogen dehydrogenase HemZ [Lachnospiraceae bacterium]|nr:coproporphyrinogen dehydrogenase HemZ [Lachnospiraceae bacterium]